MCLQLGFGGIGNMHTINKYCKVFMYTVPKESMLRHVSIALIRTVSTRGVGPGVGGGGLHAHNRNRTFI